jgi:outer membrane protein OmpA-like peptidoglycan-associated protein
MGMITLRNLALLVLLLSAAAGGAAKSSPPDLAAPLGAPSTVGVATEPPDEGVLTPPGSPPPPQEFVPAPRLGDIYFAFDGREIWAGDTRVLDENAAWLRATPNALVLIEGTLTLAGPASTTWGSGICAPTSPSPT